MGLFGGSASASNTLSNIISYSPNITVGDDNKNDMATQLDQRASSEALAKDTLSASLGVGVGGGSGSGGAVSPDNSEIDNRGTVFDAPSRTLGGVDSKYIYIAGGVAVVGGLLYFLTKKKGK